MLLILKVVLDSFFEVFVFYYETDNGKSQAKNSIYLADLSVIIFVFNYSLLIVVVVIISFRNFLTKTLILISLFYIIIYTLDGMTIVFMKNRHFYFEIFTS